MPVNYTFCMINVLQKHFMLQYIPVFKNYLLTNIIYSQYFCPHCLLSIQHGDGITPGANCCLSATPPPVCLSLWVCQPSCSAHLLLLLHLLWQLLSRGAPEQAPSSVVYVIYTMYIPVYVYNTLARICVGSCQVIDLYECVFYVTYIPKVQRSLYFQHNVAEL